MVITPCMIFTYFELDDLINDYDVTTVSGLIMTELSHIPNKVKTFGIILS
jgi:CBS domain containing-hemolysin-like protein